VLRDRIRTVAAMSVTGRRGLKDTTLRSLSLKPGSRLFKQTQGLALPPQDLAMSLSQQRKRGNFRFSVALQDTTRAFPPHLRQQA
jgi:hypothetical protein